MNSLANVFAYPFRLLMVTSLVGLLAACDTSSSDPQSFAATNDVLGLVQNHVLYMEGPSGDFKLHYASSDPSLTPRDTLVFIHDTDSNATSFQRYFQTAQIKQDYRLIAIDRPGWGSSGYPDDYPADIELQAEMLLPVLENIWQRNGQQKLILVGNGYGGALAPLLAVKYPKFIRGIVLINASITQDRLHSDWFAPALTWLPSFLLPTHWYQTQQEQADLQGKLTQTQQAFAQLTQPVAWLQSVDASSAHPGSYMRLAKNLFQQADIHLTLIEDSEQAPYQQYPEQVMRAIQAINLHSRL
ncbi:alpha/beta hydrolase [Marinomonas sp. THO17]|uniref:alpha/beta fold hydrolase n=1 Tax=Marinomonas sp. THO17 TaxID=3149048 RepID=UPI00336BB665